MSTWFGCGLLPFAPGTWGSIAALPLIVGMSYLGGVGKVAAVVLFTVLAVWSSGKSERVLGQKDPPQIVVDEVAGLMVAVLPLPFSWVHLASGFVLFRALDILKPFPARRVERDLTGGLAVVMDDLIAGIYAFAGVRIGMALWS